MGTAQHLIAIALDYIEDGKQEGDFYADSRVAALCNKRCIRCRDIWEMAWYIWVVRKPTWDQKAIRADRAWDPLPDMPVGVC